MTKETHHDAPHTIREDAAKWFLRRKNGRPTEFDWDGFELWLSSSPDHEKAYRETEEAWLSVGEQAAAPEIVSIRSAALDDYRDRAKRRWGSRRASRWGLVAATLIVGFGALVYYQVLLEPDPTTVTHATAVGETKAFTLEDGTRMSLDARSAVDVLFTDHARVVHLSEGRAYFDVDRDPRRPFQVRTTSSTVVAIGTEFSVERLNDDTFVTLLEGRVDVFEVTTRPGTRNQSNQGVTSTNDPVRLSAGQSLLVQGELGSSAVETIDVDKAAAWRQGQLHFDNTPLTTAILRVNRYSEVQVELTDVSVSELPINGVFNTGDTLAFVEALDAYFAIGWTQVDAQSIVLFRRD